MVAGTYREEQGAGVGVGHSDDLDPLIEASFRERRELVFHPSDVAGPQMSSIFAEAIGLARL